MAALVQVETHGSWGGGVVQKWQFNSTELNGPTKFTCFLPAGATKGAPVNWLLYLSGLTCTEDNFMMKAGAQREAAKQNVAIFAPDTSPRNTGIDGEDDDIYLGTGAGMYVDATQDPWKDYYRMYSYITKEFPKLVEENFPVTEKKSLFGHSMGGHGALMINLRNPGMFESCSAFAPVASPTALAGLGGTLSQYLGDSREEWENYDSIKLVEKLDPEKDREKLAILSKHEILIDQGEDDEKKDALNPMGFAAAAEGKLKVKLRMHPGMDHGYYFIACFIDDHIRKHAEVLNGQLNGDA